MESLSNSEIHPGRYQGDFLAKHQRAKIPEPYGDPGQHLNGLGLE